MKVEIWNEKLVGKEVDAHQTTHTIFTTIGDQFGSISCVRWAKHGHYFDDKFLQGD